MGEKKKNEKIKKTEKTERKKKQKETAPKKEVKASEEEEDDAFDYYNQQLPSAENDIYNIGDKTKSLIESRLQKQQQIIRQNEILEEDEKLQAEVDDTAEDQISKGTDILNENKMTLDGLIDNTTSEYL